MMNDWQEWVVALLLLLCAVRVGQGVFTFFKHSSQSKNPCDSCVSGCELRDLLERKRQTCLHAQKDKQKKCCQ